MFLGYVEQLEGLSDDKIWSGNRRIEMGDVKTVVIGILLGCKHTYWGDISKAIVELLRKVWC